MNETLYNLIVTRLLADTSMEGEAGELVLAACGGRQALVARLEGGSSPVAERSARQANGSPRSGAFIKSITVEGFRGIGPASTLELKPGPGITLVLGRNGSGKSSFAEGLEFLLTGQNKRWADRTATWREGWRNLHLGDKGRLVAEMTMESVNGGTRVTRRWGAAEGLESLEDARVKGGNGETDLRQLGWAGDVENYRPFLSYSELGSLLDYPSKMYDAISSVLGLQELVETREQLAEQRKERDKFLKGLESDLEPIRAKLEVIEDPRAEICLTELSKKKKRDLDRVREHLSLTGEAAQEEMKTLRDLATLKAPDEDSVVNVINELKSCAARRGELTGSQADRSAQIAQLLKHALRLHEVHGDRDCPVCKSPEVLSAGWRKAAETEITTLEEQAATARQLELDVKAAIANARGLIRPQVEYPVPCAVELSALDAAWRAWVNGSELDKAAEMAEHLETTYLAFAEAVEKTSAEALVELKRREDAWRPVAAAIQQWLERAETAEEVKTALKSLKTAEKWMKEAETQIRADRFAPISDAARRNWEMLRHDSNVELTNVSLAGTGTKRSVSLEVTVDGTEGAALGVMSQGELNSLALSLFLPRATLDDSPFRFVIIDDPVQAMDPSKVDGLARVLERAALTRQVVVFTHDDRLFAAVRRLGIPATAIEVTRRAGSLVTPKPTLDPAQRALEDAFAVALTPQVGSVVASKVVPGFCRAALEAAMTEAIRRKKLENGCSHREVEEALEGAKRLTTLAALFFWDDPQKGGEVYSRLARLGNSCVDTFKHLNTGAHGHFKGDALQLAKDTQRMIGELKI